MNKLYFVQCMDTWNIITFMGVYKDLKNATKDIKESFNDLAGIEELELVEYASTFDRCFDQEVYDEDSGEYLRVFGYILYSDKEDVLEIKTRD